MEGKWQTEPFFGAMDNTQSCAECGPLEMMIWDKKLRGPQSGEGEAKETYE